MSKKVNKRKQLNYKPIIIGAAIVVPLWLVVLAFIVKPSKPEQVAFEVPVACTGQISESGTVVVNWTTSVESSAVLYYRHKGKVAYSRMSSGMRKDHVLAIPTNVGDQLEFYVEVRAKRSEAKSEPMALTVTQRATDTAPAAKGKP